MPRRKAGGPTPPSPRALQQGLRQVLTSVRAEIDRAIERPTVAPETLHDLHRDLRRLSSGLKLWAELLEPRDAAELPPTIRRLRRFARLVGRVRDRDVTLALLEPLARRAGGATQGPMHGFLGQLREDGRTGRELLRAFLTTERQGGLLDQVRASLDRKVRPGARHQIDEIFHDEWQAHRRKMRKAHRKARKWPTTTRLHRLRIRIRRWRHLASLAEIAGVSAPEPLDPGLRALQERLGRLHDLDIALTTLPEELGRTQVARQLSTRLRLEQARTHVLIRRRAEVRRTSAPRGGPGARKRPR